MATKSDAERARDILTRQLAMMDRSRKQLEEALARRGIPEDIAAQALADFTELGLIDDAHFAQVLVRTRLNTTRTSKRAITGELRRKGVDAQLIEEATASIDEETELSNATALALKKLRLASGKPETLSRRTYAALARRGFSPAICSKALKEAERIMAEGGEGSEVVGGGSLFGYSTSLS